MKLILIPLIIAVILIVWFIATMNGLRRRRVQIDESLSGIDVALAKRYDSLTKIMQTAKAFAAHETELLTKVIDLRSGMTMAKRREAEALTNAMAERVSFLAEAYPELRSSETYRQLQLAVVDAEEHLQAARRLYNSNVSAFNQAIVSFPKSLVAGFLGMQPLDYFRAEDAKREDVKIDL